MGQNVHKRLYLGADSKGAPQPPFPPLPPPQLSLAYPPWSLSAPATVSVGSLPSQSYVDVVGGFSFTCVFLPPPGTTALSLGPGAHLVQVLLIGIALGVVSEELGFQAPDPG